MSTQNAREESHRAVLVTGPSGAGRSTALNALEDLGFETIDNLPLNLISRLFDGPPIGRPLALGVDSRNRDFSTARLIDLITMLQSRSDIQTELLYLDCSDDVLIRRFSETRRRHPLAPAESAAEGVIRDNDLMQPIKALADVLIDTTEITIHDLRADLSRLFGTAMVAENPPRVVGWTVIVNLVFPLNSRRRKSSAFPPGAWRTVRGVVAAN